MRRVIVFGAAGWAGSALVAGLSGEGVTRETCDINSPDDVEGVLRLCRGETHVINAMGRNINGNIEKYADESCATMVEDNLMSSLYIARAFLRVRPQSGSSVIFLSSVVPRLGVRGAAVYAAVKASISGAVNSLAKDFAPNYRINAIEMGYFDGGMIRTVPEEHMGRIVRSVPLRRLGDAESLVQTCEYLIGCSYATGGAVPLTGGL